jgi:hypothetical protein
MRKPALLILAAVMAGTSFVASVPTAQSQSWRDRDSYIEDYYRRNDHDRDYDRWQRDRRRWNDDDYRGWYESRRRGNPDAAAAIFGLAAGALLGGLATGAIGSPAPVAGAAPPAGGYPFGSDGYYRYCSGKYRSFDPASGTFLGYDGQRHYCQ